MREKEIEKEYTCERVFMREREKERESIRNREREEHSEQREREDRAVCTLKFINYY